ncbi:MAG: hypothetical protein ACTSPA_04245 [Promethearchaeota archaeon]
MDKMKQAVEFVNKYSTYFAIFLTFILSIIFSLISFWQLTFVAAIFGGFLCTKMKCGALGAMIGMIISWGILIIIGNIRNNTIILFDQLGVLITGSTGLGFWLILIVLIVGGIIGLLGGTIGSGIRILVEPKFSSNETVSE